MSFTLISRLDLVRLIILFHRTRSTRQKSVQGLLRPLLLQLFDAGRPDIYLTGIADWMVEICEKSDSLRRLHGILDMLSAHPSNCFLLVFDALGECEDDRGVLLDCIAKLRACGNVKICVARRPLKIFRVALEEFPQLYLDEASGEGISVLVSSKLARWGSEMPKGRTGTRVKRSGSSFFQAALLADEVESMFVAGVDEETLRRRVDEMPQVFLLEQ